MGILENVAGYIKIPLTRPIIYALFSQFLSASGADPHRGSAQTLQVSLYCNILHWNKV